MDTLGEALLARRTLPLAAACLLVSCSAEQVSVTGSAVAAGTGGVAAAASGAAGSSAAAGVGGTAAGAVGPLGPGAPAAGRSGTAGTPADGGRSGTAAVSGGGGGSAAAGNASIAGASGAATAGSGGASAPSGLSPVHRIPLRIHTAQSELTDTELEPILAEMNAIWLSQAGVCFEIEVTDSEDDREDGFDFRYTSGQIPGSSGSNGVFQSAHSIWSIDRPRLNDVSMPVMHPTARTTAHELGHALGLAHENPPPSSDCSRPCHCVELGDDCDEYLMRSGTKGFFLSEPEVETARGRAARVALSDQAPSQCGAPIFMR